MFTSHVYGFLLWRKKLFNDEALMWECQIGLISRTVHIYGVSKLYLGCILMSVNVYTYFLAHVFSIARTCTCSTFLHARDVSTKMHVRRVRHTVDK